MLNKGKLNFGLCLIVLLAGALILAPVSFARVARIDITERVPFADGMRFGNVGAYEKIKGTLTYAVDPDNAYNAQIVDLQMAKVGRLRSDISEVTPEKIIEIVGDNPVNAAGEVVFSGDFILLKPVNLNKGNHRLFYDVNNRGRPLALGNFNDAPSSNDPTTVQDAGNGWLMRQGYSILWTGWNWDVERAGDNPLRIFLPIIVESDGSPMVSWINAELTVWDRDGVQSDWFAWGGSRCYKAAEGKDADGNVYKDLAVLSVRDVPDVDKIGPRDIIPREDWQFAALDENGDLVLDPVADADHVFYADGFIKGKIYELLYWAKNPRVVGLGLAGIRDAISFFHFELEDDYGNPNPLLRLGEPDPEYAYIFGISQSGRVINTMIYQGFHVDEQGRMVFEAARPNVPGGGKGGFNYRWAQTTHHPKHIEGNYFPADHFPFNFTPDGEWQFDPYPIPDGQFGDVLAVAKALGKIPKIMHTNHGLEYWTRSGSLVHTNVQGTQDAQFHENFRAYMVNGSAHGAPSARNNSLAEHSQGTVDQRPADRALLVALDKWVTHGIEPPPSTVPRIDRLELITVEKHKADFPPIPAYNYGGIEFRALRDPGKNLKPPRVDYGPRFFMPMPPPINMVDVPISYPGIQDNVPPDYFGPPYETRVPNFDADGNDFGGIRMPDLTVPLGTYQGWNPRRTGTGASDYLRPFDASFWPFALTKDERLEKGDPRLSIEERYKNKKDYVNKVKAAARDLRQQGFLIMEDEKKIVDLAEKLVWPPVPTNSAPFWQVEE